MKSLNISKISLLEQSHAYIKDGILEKWRFDSLDKEHIDHKLNVKYLKGESLTKEEIECIINSTNKVIIEMKHELQFFNFSGSAFKF